VSLVFSGQLAGGNVSRSRKASTPWDRCWPSRGRVTSRRVASRRSSSTRSRERERERERERGTWCSRDQLCRMLGEPQRNAPRVHSTLPARSVCPLSPRGDSLPLIVAVHDASERERERERGREGGREAQQREDEEPAGRVILIFSNI